jgi:adiponectin receptor
MIISDSPGFIPNQSFKLFLFGGLIYIIGAFIYMGRLPEKACPGIFCIWGSSHQIWHCLVITGILFHYMASITVYHNRINFSECPL